MQAVITAGGSGQRLRPITGNTPKVLAPVNGRPFLWWLLHRLAKSGVTSVHLCLGIFSEQVCDYLTNSGAPLAVSVSVESHPLGVFGALRLAEPFLEESFFLLYGDVLPAAPLARVQGRFAAAGTAALMSVSSSPHARERFNAELRSGQIVGYGKDRRISYTHLDIGTSMFTLRPVMDMPTGIRIDEGEVFSSLSAQGQLAAFEWPDLPLHIGDPESYFQMCKELEHGFLGGST